LRLQTLTERSLRIAVPASHPLARGELVDVADLHGQRWIAGSGEDRVMGVWPGLDERPDIAHTARDWLAKLHLVAVGCGITTVPAVLLPAVPPGVRILPVRGGPAEQRRILLARLPQPLPGPASRVADALRTAAIETDTPA
jgi:DNA-binding transcriptional LysR family regulator